MAGMAISAPDRNDDEPGERHREQPRDAVVADEVAERGRADGREPELRTATPGPDVSHQETQRQEQDDVITAIVQAASFSPTRSGTSRSTPTSEHGRPMLTRAGARVRAVRRRRRRGAAQREQAPRRDEQRDEQDDEREARREGRPAK